MKSLARLGFLGWSALLWLVAGIICLAAYIIPPLFIFSLPLTFPGLFVFGDEADERYGFGMMMFYAWLISLPCALAYAGLIRLTLAGHAHFMRNAAVKGSLK